MKFPKLKIDKVFLFVGVSLLPIYVSASGGLQPTHLALSLFFAFVLSNYGGRLMSWSIGLFAIFIHSFIIECIYGMLNGNISNITHSVFFLYNFLLVNAIYIYVRRNGLTVIVPAIMIAAGIAFATILMSGVDLRGLEGGARSAGTFNNPNQLGYFSVCLLSLTYLFYRQENIRYAVALCMFSISVYLAISSLSKAAMIANFVVIVVALKPITSKKAVLAWIVASFIGGFVLVRMFSVGEFDDYLFTTRLVGMASENDSSLESRGYFAFLEGNAAQMIFGLGYQGSKSIVGHEIHSTFGSVLNNYGVIGLLFFSSALILWFKCLWQAYGLIGLISIAAPAMLYGITHNGTRFTIFWLLFAASIAIAQKTKYENSLYGGAK